MSVHDFEMFTRGALAADLAILATWWLTGRAERRKAARHLAEARKRLDADEKGFAKAEPLPGQQPGGRR